MEAIARYLTEKGYEKDFWSDGRGCEHNDFILKEGDTVSIYSVAFYTLDGNIVDFKLVKLREERRITEC